MTGVLEGLQVSVVYLGDVGQGEGSCEESDPGVPVVGEVACGGVTRAGPVEDQAVAAPFGLVDVDDRWQPSDAVRGDGIRRGADRDRDDAVHSARDQATHHGIGEGG